MLFRSCYHNNVMKIKNNVTIIETTYDEMIANLRSYQQDMIYDLFISACPEGSTAAQKSEFLLKLLTEGQGSEWFENLIEKHSIHWLSWDPDHNRHTELQDLIESFPYVFGIGTTIEEIVDNNFDENVFEVWVSGHKLNSKTIWSNI